MKARKLPARIVRRAWLLGGMVSLLFAVFAVRLYDVQVTDHEMYRALAQQHSLQTLPLAATRGDILDRNGRPLVINEVACEVVFDPQWFPTESAAQNAVIAALCDLLDARGDVWQDTLPISTDTPFVFLPSRDEGVAALTVALEISASATAAECMAALVARYGLEEYTAPHQRWLAGVRYEMEMRQFGLSSPYVFGTAVSTETGRRIRRDADVFCGVTVQTAVQRVYAADDAAAHLLGTVGPMYAEEYAALKEQGYALNDTLGKSGAEAAFEPFLRGVAGRRVLRKNTQGEVVEVVEDVLPVAGDTVKLTLDATLQTAAGAALDTVICDLRALPASSRGSFLNNGHDVKSGAVVVLDVADGGVLAAASWPWYDPATYCEEYTALLNDPDRPLFNRALYGTFACGSVMKPAVALAALSEGVITADDTVSCNGKYTRFSAAGLVLHCMGRHGRLNVADALQRSCNVFFYDTADKVGIEQMNVYAALCGLGEKTGIEVGEAAGVLAGPIYREAMGGVWTAADTAGAAIGQSDNLFTPIQLATYAMTLANDGVRYKTHLFHSRLASNGRVKETYTPQIASRGMFSQEAMDTVREGMVAAATRGTAAAYFRNTAYTVACKTGTAQVAQNRSDHGVFIAFAPAESPEIAVAVVVENGTSAASLRVARAVMDAYFEGKAEKNE